MDSELWLNINYQTGKVLYGGCPGWNALKELLRLKKGNVFFDDGFETFINVLEMEDASYE